MGNKASSYRLYASLLALGACILLSRTITMLAQGALTTLVLWVFVLTIAEMLIDLSCLVSSVFWLTNDSRQKSRRIALRLGASAAILHAVRVAIFVIGRVGPWIDFDVRPEERAMHYTRWNMNEVYFAATLSVLGIIGVIVIWAFIRRQRKRGQTL